MNGQIESVRLCMARAVSSLANPICSPAPSNPFGSLVFSLILTIDFPSLYGALSKFKFSTNKVDAADDDDVAVQ